MSCGGHGSDQHLLAAVELQAVEEQAVVDALVRLVVAGALRIEREVGRRRGAGHQDDAVAVHRAETSVGVVDADQGLARAAGRELELVRQRAGPAQEGVERQDAVAGGGGERRIDLQGVADDPVGEVDRPGRAGRSILEAGGSEDLEHLWRGRQGVALDQSGVGDRPPV